MSFCAAVAAAIVFYACQIGRWRVGALAGGKFEARLHARFSVHMLVCMGLGELFSVVRVVTALTARLDRILKGMNFPRECRGWLQSLKGRLVAITSSASWVGYTCLERTR
ncbi:hypothetical protein BKA81DRAFT_214724 [Phyllosticta paracitricarpa]|uniref:Uncharacterized protein n=1 Tax=Phyllosticta paracitricarpa TaxID=2016321 RepID=A0ABR1MSX3_9PEZI